MEISYFFIHNEWMDKCILDTLNLIIKREICENEKGTYKFEDNKIIINWYNWEGYDIFINKYDYFYHEDIFNKYMNTKNIYQYEFIENDISIICILNYDQNIIFSKKDLKKIGNFEVNNNFLIITFESLNKEKFIKIDDKYYHKKYLDENKIRNNVKIERFKKINNSYYYIDTIINTELVENKYEIINTNLDINKIQTNLLSLINNNDLNNKKYLNIDNIKIYINSPNYDLFDNFLNINFEIPIKKKKRFLSLVEWGYPPFGGGENWILNLNKILSKNEFETYLICFSDPFKNEYFNKIKLINLDYVHIIQMPKDLINIIKIIKIINPDIINHQGVHRLYFMKISNILEIPFLTGFCFWQDIIKFNMNNLNLNMLTNKKLEKTDYFETIINNSYSYASSEFVNDIIYKFYNLKLDVIESISLEEDFLVNSNLNNKKYVTLINCHYNKGGYLIKYLCENLDINIPLQFVYTENDPNITAELVKNLIDARNIKKNINILIPNKINIKSIYEKTKIILLPSLCEETFCRVAYESMHNNIPILSSKNGNLKYLLKEYAIFIDDIDIEKWKIEIEELYYNKKKIINFKNKKINILNYNLVETKIINKINTINNSKYKLNNQNIGIIIPWADQGLGIQGRDYYITLKELGYNPYVLSFKPYHATHENIYLQSDRNEWIYDNIYYSNSYRENLSYDEILDFVHKFNIKKIIIIEATFMKIFNIAFFLKLLNIKIYIVVNIECIRLIELNNHNIFDKILTNNIESQLIMSKIFEKKSKYLGFNLNHQYFKNIVKSKKNNLDIIKFFCIGGLNSLSRKNISLTIITFFNIFSENIYLNWELNIYIQGVEIPDIIDKYKCKNINYYINNLSYKMIINKYIENDIFIHMGSHEGLGLGFYESLYCGTPVLTMDWTPNNEIINNNVNGWLINCDYTTINDNDNSLINRGIINEKDLKNKIIEILNKKENTLKIINSTIENKNNLQNKNKNIFEKNLIDILNE